jgi:hypothetical protein
MALYKIFHQRRRLDVNELFNSYSYGNPMLVTSSQELNIPLNHGPLQNYSTQIHIISASYLLADLQHDPPIRFWDDNAAMISHAHNTDV